MDFYRGTGLLCWNVMHDVWFRYLFCRAELTRAEIQYLNHRLQAGFVRLMPSRFCAAVVWAACRTRASIQRLRSLCSTSVGRPARGSARESILT